MRDIQGCELWKRYLWPSRQKSWVCAWYPQAFRLIRNRVWPYLRNTLKRGSAQSLKRYVQMGAPTDWTQIADALLRQVATEGGVFHLWGHSWEIEKTSQWRNLERVFELMSSYVADIPCVNNTDLCHRRDTIQSAGQAMRVGSQGFSLETSF